MAKKLFGSKFQGFLINALIVIVTIMVVNRVKPLKKIVFGE